MALDESQERLRDWLEINLRQNATRPQPAWIRASHIKEKTDALGLSFSNAFLSEEMTRLGFRRNVWREGGRIVRVWQFCDASPQDIELKIGKLRNQEAVNE